LNVRSVAHDRLTSDIAQAGSRPLTDRSLDQRTVMRETNEGDDMMHDLQGEMITALENYRTAFENGTLNLQTVRILIAAIIAAG
jgi:hypothetical protein